MNPLSAVEPRWSARAQRARTLLAERPHTEALLRFYLSLLDLQAPVCDPDDAARWLPAVVTASASELPRLRLERLPLHELSSRFQKFCEELPPTAPEPIRIAARAVSDADPAPRTELLLA